ncbi:MAG TPA: ferredoxin [Cyanobacteria bacterium UBA8530]|jgi:ferredoxin|nr:ferredoxin [Cyanobacteria bacterium UBA8530]
MKAIVDLNLCIGCGACEGICPQVFRMESDGLAHVIEGADCDAAGCCPDAAESCPVAAIAVE